MTEIEKSLKKFLSILLALIMAFGMLMTAAVSAAADNEATLSGGDGDIANEAGTKSVISDTIAEGIGISGSDGDLYEGAFVASLMGNDSIRSVALFGGDGDIAQQAGTKSALGGKLNELIGISGSDGDLAECAFVASLMGNDAIRCVTLSGGDGDSAREAGTKSVLSGKLNALIGISGSDGDYADGADVASLISNKDVKTIGISGSDGDLYEEAFVASLIGNNAIRSVTLSGGDGDSAREAGTKSVLGGKLNEVIGVSGSDGDFAEGAFVASLMGNDAIRSVTLSGGDGDSALEAGTKSVLGGKLNEVIGVSGSDGDFSEGAFVASLMGNDAIRRVTLNGGDGDLAEGANVASLIINRQMFVSHALVLSGEIGVVFNVYLPAGFNTDGAYMTYETGKVGSAEQTIDNATYDNDTGLWSFTCYLGSYRMADKITPTFHWFENGEEQTASGAPYAATDYIAFVEANPGIYEDKVVDFCNALHVYGYCSQQYLGRIHSFTVGDDEDDKYAAVTEPETGNIDAESIEEARAAVAGYLPTKTIDQNRVSKTSFALDLESATLLYVNITVKNGAVPTKAQLADGTELPITKRSKTVYRVSLDGIKASRLLDRFTIQVYEGDNQIAEVTVSPMSYVYMVYYIDSPQFEYEDLRNLVAALYLYAYRAKELITP